MIWGANFGINYKPLNAFAIFDVEFRKKGANWVVGEKGDTCVVKREHSERADIDAAWIVFMFVFVTFHKGVVCIP